MKKYEKATERIIWSSTVAQWENAFYKEDGKIEIIENFCNLDSDRFRVRIPFRSDVGNSFVKFGTDSDNLTELNMRVSQEGSFLESDFQILVSGDIDNDHQLHGLGPKDAKGDRTHLFKIGDVCTVEASVGGDSITKKFVPNSGRTRVCEIRPIIVRNEMGGSNPAEIENVETAIRNANKRFAQVNLRIEVRGSIEIKNPPPTIDMSNGLKSAQFNDLIDYWGTESPDDIHVFIVDIHPDNLFKGLQKRPTETTTNWSPKSNGSCGTAMSLQKTSMLMTMRFLLMNWRTY